MSDQTSTYPELEKQYQTHYRANTFVRSGKVIIKVDGITTGVLGFRPFLLEGGVLVYIVRSGDTLSQISQMFGAHINRLAKMNKIEDIDHIQTGQRLVIDLCSIPI